MRLELLLLSKEPSTKLRVYVDCKALDCCSTLYLGRSNRVKAAALDSGDKTSMGEQGDGTKAEDAEATRRSDSGRRGTISTGELGERVETKVLA